MGADFSMKSYEVAEEPMKISPRPPGRWLTQLRSILMGLGNSRGKIMQNSPSRKKLPRVLVMPWWVVFVVLGGTAVVSVSYSVGEEHPVEEESSHENQDVTEIDSDEEPSEEASLIQQLEARLQALEEREQRLQQKEERILGLQRDVEALAARQAKEAERLKKETEAFEAEKNKPPEEDPSLDHLVKVYEAMDPEEAALRIEKMSNDLALEILSGIKNKKAAVVLAGVKAEKAAKLSEGLRKFKNKK